MQIPKKRRKMTDHEKVVEYELQIEDMLHDLQERLNEFDKIENMDDFEKGRQLAYTEIRDIIQSRHEMIMEVLSE